MEPAFWSDFFRYTTCATCDHSFFDEYSCLNGWTSNIKAFGDLVMLTTFQLSTSPLLRQAEDWHKSDRAQGGIQITELALLRILHSIYVSHAK
jgi:hypothetical protein